MMDSPIPLPDPVGGLVAELIENWKCIHAGGQTSETSMTELLPSLPEMATEMLGQRGDLILRPVDGEAGSFENLALRKIEPFNVGKTPKVKVELPDKIAGTYEFKDGGLQLGFPEKDTSIKGGVGPMTGHIQSITMMDFRMLVFVSGMFGFEKELEFVWS